MSNKRRVIPRKSSVSRFLDATPSAVAAVGGMNARMQVRSVTPDLFEPERSGSPNAKRSQSPSPSQCDNFVAPEVPERSSLPPLRKLRRWSKKETMEKTATSEEEKDTVKKETVEEETTERGRSRGGSPQSTPIRWGPTKSGVVAPLSVAKKEEYAVTEPSRSRGVRPSRKCRPHNTSWRRRSGGTRRERRPHNTSWRKLYCRCQ